MRATGVSCWVAATLGAAILGGTTGCGPEVVVDLSETANRLDAVDGPTVEFDPAGGVIPLPSDLLRGADGRLQLPATCGESPSGRHLREQVLNRLDGFGTYQPRLTVFFSERPDFESLAGRVRLFRLPGTAAADPEEIPVDLLPSTSERFGPDCHGSQLVDTVTLVPRWPLAGGSSFAVALLSGITADHEPFIPSTTWALVRMTEDPVVVEAGEVVAHRTPLDPLSDEGRTDLLAIDLLWKSQAPMLAALDDALDRPRSQILLAYSFTTLSVPGALDPARTGSPAASIPRAPLSGVSSLMRDPVSGDPISAVAFLELALGIDSSTCVQLGCATVGDVVGGVLAAPSYQRETNNRLAGGDPIPGAWDDPVEPGQQGEEAIPVLAVIPASTAPASGYPTVIFGHGITRSKEDLLAIAPALTVRGIAVVGIDWVAHGARAVRTSDVAFDTGFTGVGCAGELDLVATGAQAHCFAPFFSTDLTATRDNFRQSALDGLALHAALAACDDACGALRVDPDRIGYLGQSLGALIGTLVTAMAPELDAAVLNVGGAGLVDLIENTDELGLRCAVVDALIASGVLLGTPLDIDAGTGTCLEQTWTSQPGWQSFATGARWVLDPADPANFTSRLADRPVLIQAVDEDRVIPNLITDRLAELLGASLGDRRWAEIATSLSPMASRAVNDADRGLTWVLYEDVPAANLFAGNSYHHGSLLTPPGDCQESVSCFDGQLGVAQMQTDAVTFLAHTLGAP